MEFNDRRNTVINMNDFDLRISRAFYDESDGGPRIFLQGNDDMNLHYHDKETCESDYDTLKKLFEGNRGEEVMEKDRGYYEKLFNDAWDRKDAINNEIRKLEGKRDECVRKILKLQPIVTGLEAIEEFEEKDK